MNVCGVVQVQEFLHMDQQHVKATVESRPTCTFHHTGQCFAVEGIPADTLCSTEGCTGWFHYDPCYTHFFATSEFYPSLYRVDTHSLREGSIVAFCKICTMVIVQEYREIQDLVQYNPTISDGNDYDGSDSNTTQEYDHESGGDDPMG